MRHLKMLALAAAVAGALMASIGAGTASASVACSTQTTPCESRWPNVTWTWSHSGPGSLFIKEVGGGETIDTCTGQTIKGTMNNGNSTATVSGSVSAENLTWTGCTFPTKTLKGGTLEVHNINGTSNGTVTGSGFEMTINTVFFGSCAYGTGESAVLGKITEGNPAITHTEGLWHRIFGGALCPEKVEMLSTEALTSPSNTTLVIEPY